MKILKHGSVIAILLFVFSAGVIAQPGPGRQKKPADGFRNASNAGIPNLTEEQKTKMKEIRLGHLKETQPLKNQLGELKARQKTLSTAEKPDMKAIDSNIDDITKVQNQLFKKSAAAHQQIRSLLNDEQKLWFDSRPMHKMHHKNGMQKRNFNSQAGYRYRGGRNI